MTQMISSCWSCMNNVSADFLKFQTTGYWSESSIQQTRIHTWTSICNWYGTVWVKRPRYVAAAAIILELCTLELLAFHCRPLTLETVTYVWSVNRSFIDLQVFYSGTMDGNTSALLELLNLFVIYSSPGQAGWDLASLNGTDHLIKGT